MPIYRITHPDISKPMAVEATNPKAARAWAAKRFVITPLDARESFDLAQQGIELEQADRNGR